MTLLDDAIIRAVGRAVLARTILGVLIDHPHAQSTRQQAERVAQRHRQQGSQQNRVQRVVHLVPQVVQDAARFAHA